MLRIDKWAFSCGPTATLQLSSHLMYLHCILSFTCNKHRNMSISHVRNKMSSRPLKSCAEYEKTWRKRPFGPSNAPEPLHEVNKTKEIHYEKKNTHWHSPPPGDSPQRILAPRGGHAAHARARSFPRRPIATYKSPPNAFPSRCLELPPFLPLPPLDRFPATREQAPGKEAKG